MSAVWYPFIAVFFVLAYFSIVVAALILWLYISYGWTAWRQHRTERRRMRRERARREGRL